MENIEVYENEIYQKGEETPATLRNILKFFILNVMLVIKITAFMISEPFYGIWYFLKKRNRKFHNLEGQIALITGDFTFSQFSIKF